MHRGRCRVVCGEGEPVKLSLSELIHQVGDENVEFQNLFECCTNLQSRKNGATAITFLTNAITPVEVLKKPPSKLALVVWLPADKANEVIANSKEDGATLSDSTERIVTAAKNLHDFLGHNSGTTADFPVDIKVDNEEDAIKLGALLQELSDALKARLGSFKERNPTV